MRKYFLAIVVVAMFSFSSCSSDDNTSDHIEEEIVDPEIPEEEEEEEVNILHGKWIPQVAHVDALGNAIEENYPHKDDCDKDYLEIEAEVSKFGMHAENCDLEVFSQEYVLDGDSISLNLLSFDVNLTIVDNTEDTLILGGNGVAFAPLIPLLFPEYADMIPEALLHLVTVELELTK